VGETMSNELVIKQTNTIKNLLEEINLKLELFLDDNNLNTLEVENVIYLKSVYKQLRKLSVYCDDAYEACKLLLSDSSPRNSAMEKVLYRVYHYCVEEFFNPKADVWFENSRSAYTGRNSIKFRENVSVNIEKLVHELEGTFHKIREELEYFETDYRTKMMQSK
jgi:hypothetical protein